MNNFPLESKCWIYAADRILTPLEIENIKDSGKLFVQSWTSHQKQMHATVDVLHDLFIIITVDESQADISGCGIDKSVAWVKQLGEKLNINFFNRTQIEMQLSDGSFNIVSKAAIASMLKNNAVNHQTIFANKNISNLNEFQQSFYVTLESTWFYSQVTSIAMQV